MDRCMKGKGEPKDIGELCNLDKAECSQFDCASARLWLGMGFLETQGP